VLACRDVTERREAERRLQARAEEVQLGKVGLERAYRRLDAANRELAARTEQLDALNAELRKLDEMKSNLLGNVSHELQTPLVSIRGYTEMILKERLGPITGEQRKGLELSLRNIDRLITMIDNVMVFARSEPDLGRVTPSRFPLGGAVEEAAALLGDEMVRRGLELRVDVADDLTAWADRDKVLQVFLNLLSNAVKFNREGGRIEITARGVRPDTIEVSVSDTGVGIPPEALERVFDRHFQVDRGEGAPGAGIGLAIVRDILRLHGCRIAAESEPGWGTRFTFTLPREAGGASGANPATPGPDEPRPPADPPDAGPPRADRPPSRFRIIRR